jgi:tetratricopeptide (TPR) repeat protein
MNKASPSLPPIRTLLRDGESHVGAGRLKEAESCYKQAIAQNPSQHEAYFGLAQIALRIQDFQSAMQLIAKSIQLAPDAPVYYYQLGMLYHRQQQFQRAADCYKRVIQLTPGSPEGYTGYAAAMLAQQQLPEAREALEQAITARPTFAEALFLRAHMALMAGNLVQADADFQAILSKNPTDLTMLDRISHLCWQARYISGAITYCEKRLAVAPSADAEDMLASALEKSNRVEEALIHAEKAVALAPKNTAYLNNLGLMQSKMGKLEEGKNSFKRVMLLEPNLLAPYMNLAHFHRFSDADTAEIENLKRFIDRPGSQKQEQAALFFTLGKAMDDCKRYDEAFAYYAKGNSLMRRLNPYDKSENSRLFTALKQVFTKEFFAKNTLTGHTSDAPIFIVGMPRSGTTLTEQMLSSHPDIAGAGELEHLIHLTLLLPKILETETAYPEVVRHFTQEKLLDVAESYLTHLRGFSGGLPHITDKMPYNFLHLGLIALLFPKARIIHCTRDLVDTGLSIYFQRFVSGNTYAYDLADIAEYIREYHALMQHWQEVLPISIVEAPYSAMVADSEEETRRILEALNLPWDDACLQREENTRAVRTASVWQVRQPIYTRSLARWKRYASHIQPLTEGLDGLWNGE